MLLGWELLRDPQPNWNRWQQQGEFLNVLSFADPNMVFSARIVAQENVMLDLEASGFSNPLPELDLNSRVWILGREGIFRVVGEGILWHTGSGRWRVDVEHTYRSQRRRSPRVRLERPFRVEAVDLLNHSTFFWVMDMGDGGALLRPENSEAEVSDLLDLRLPVETWEKPLHVRVVVRNRRQQDAGGCQGPVYGVQWPNNVNDHERLRNWRDRQMLWQSIHSELKHPSEK